MHTDSGMTGISLSGYMPYMTVASLEMSDEPLLGVSSDSANKFRSRTRQKLCPDQKGGDINEFILQKGW